MATHRRKRERWREEHYSRERECVYSEGVRHTEERDGEKWRRRGERERDGEKEREREK